MKHCVLPILTLAIGTFQVQAAANENQPSGEDTSRALYAGLDVAFANTNTLETSGASVDETSDFGDAGFNLVLGYEFNTHKVVKIDLEAEYRQLGKVNFSDILDISGSGLFVNVKPKLIVEYGFGDVYLSPFAGIGYVDVDAKSSLYGIDTSQSEFGYQYGVDLGFIVNRNVDLIIGYRSVQATLDKVDVSFGSGYVGARYYF